MIVGVWPPKDMLLIAVLYKPDWRYKGLSSSVEQVKLAQLL